MPFAPLRMRDDRERPARERRLDLLLERAEDGDHRVVADGQRRVGGRFDECAAAMHEQLLRPSESSRAARRQQQAGESRSRVYAIRRHAITSASIETAISAGETARIGRPAGPWMRASSASPKPRSRSRSRRAAWFLREPRAPM